MYWHKVFLMDMLIYQCEMVCIILHSLSCCNIFGCSLWKECVLSKKRRHYFQMDSEDSTDSPHYGEMNGLEIAVNGQSSSGETENQGPHTLDTIIPWPSSYEGLNHPFKVRNGGFSMKMGRDRVCLTCW